MWKVLLFDVSSTIFWLSQHRNKSVSCNYTKILENKTTLNIVNASYLFTQFSTLAKIYKITAREPSIYGNFIFLEN